jgi:peptide-methionine (R)-S-oxide reductase
MMSHKVALALALCLVASATPLRGGPGDPPPPACPKSTPGPSGTKKCPLAAPSDPEFADICHPGATGHAGGAEQPQYRCPRVNYTDGVFRCACCGAPLFYAVAKFQPQGDGWPAFHGENATIGKDGKKLGVCSPGGTEVVCQSCGSHLGDYFAAGVQGDYSYYCIDGVCLLPPDAKPGHVCKPGPPLAPSKADAYKALRHMMRDRGAAAVHAHDHH